MTTVLRMLYSHVIYMCHTSIHEALVWCMCLVRLQFAVSFSSLDPFCRIHVYMCSHVVLACAFQALGAFEATRCRQTLRHGRMTTVLRMLYSHVIQVVDDRIVIALAAHYLFQVCS